VDRILEAEILDDTFVRPAGFASPEALMNAAANTPGSEWSVEVLLEMALEDARRQLPSTGLALEPAEGGALLRCRTWDLGWVARLLAGLDRPFIVRRPAELRRALERRAGEITALARRTDAEASS
jgi:hypothetical protein